MTVTVFAHNQNDFLSCGMLTTGKCFAMTTTRSCFISATFHAACFPFVAGEQDLRTFFNWRSGNLFVFAELLDQEQAKVPSGNLLVTVRRLGEDNPRIQKAHIQNIEIGLYGNRSPSCLATSAVEPQHLVHSVNACFCFVIEMNYVGLSFRSGVNCSL